MRRREVLSLVGTVAVAGCQQVGSRPFETIPPRKIARVRAETNYDVELSLSASIVQEQITPDEQARVELTVVWQGTEPAWFRELPSDRYKLGDPIALWLLPPTRKTNRRDQQTWVVADDSTGFQGGLKRVKYEPGETVTQKYDLWANPYETDWIHPGVYQSDQSAHADGWFTPWTFEMEIVAVDTE